MAPPELSIIIPCFNSTKTLQQAVDSCYTQGLSSFEVIMVDDGSSDNTRAMMQNQAYTHGNIHVFFHENNKGGGAARNTAISHSCGTYVFCLDSDDILPPGTLSSMLDFIKRTGVDGAVFHERHFFNKRTFFPHNIHVNTLLERSVECKDLFSNEGFLFNNFLYSRKAYDATAGYPEHHGFDTQSFEVRFLMADKKAVVCPNSVYYHRQTATPSYYDRERDAGNVSKNMYFVFEDMLPILSDTTRTYIANWDLQSVDSEKKSNLLDQLRKLYAQAPDTFFQNTQHLFVGEDNRKKYIQSIEHSTMPADIFCRGVFELTYGDPQGALDIFVILLKARYGGMLLYFNSLRALAAMTKDTTPVKALLVDTFFVSVPHRPMEKRIISSVRIRMVQGYLSCRLWITKKISIKSI